MSTADMPVPVVAQFAAQLGAHVLVVRAPYYRDVVDGMAAGAARILAGSGATYDTLDVAGAFELAQAVRLALRGPVRYDGFVALGCVVRGETDHYEFICRTSLDGLMHVALQYGIAMGTGLLTVHDLAQAVARSSHDDHNKGAEAAAACLSQVAIRRRFG